MREGLSGHTGDLSGLELLSKVASLGCTGTLVFETEQGCLLLALEKGNTLSSQRLGYCELEEQALRFHIRQHEANPIAKLSSCFSQSSLPVLRALPHFGLTETLPPKSLDLQAFLSYLKENAFSGYLSLEQAVDRGLILFLEGKLSAALFESDGQIRENTEALRSIRRLSLAQDSHLQYRALDRFVIKSLLGLAFNRLVKKDPSFSGLESSELGYSYYQDGEILWQVASELRGRSGCFALFADAPELSLPLEPAGWEQQRYLLTLRGRDALNPITELAMQFQSSSGRLGKRLLELLHTGKTPETLTDTLNLSLSELRPWLERLEKEGLVRRQES